MEALDVIYFTCPSCNHQSRVAAIYAGKTITCPGCKRSQQVPGRAPVAAPVKSALPPTISAVATATPATEGERIRFICASCGYRALIPAYFKGMAVNCPSCETAQIATAEDAVPATGMTVTLNRVSSAQTTASTPPRPGNIIFRCPACRYEAQLAERYLGKTIRCPGCHEPQLVGTPEAPVAAPARPAAPADGKILFICSSCNYRARIPQQYVGVAVRCPSCNVSQIATAHDQPSTGQTVSISRMETAPATESGTHGGDAIDFVCSACGFATQFSAGFAGKVIRCPGCQAEQMVGTAPEPQAAEPPPPQASAGGSEKVRFTCTACGFRARIPAHYAGQTIHCPGCNMVQLVLRTGPSPATGQTQIINLVQTAASGNPPTAASSALTPAKPHPVVPGPTDPPMRVARPFGGTPVANPAIPVAQPSPQALPVARLAELPPSVMPTAEGVEAEPLPAAQPTQAAAPAAPAEAVADELVEAATPRPPPPRPVRPGTRSSQGVQARSGRNRPAPPPPSRSGCASFMVFLVRLAMLGAIGYGGYMLYHLDRDVKDIRQKLETARNEAAQAKEAKETEAKARKEAEDRAAALERKLAEQAKPMPEKLAPAPEKPAPVKDAAPVPDATTPEKSVPVLEKPAPEKPAPDKATGEGKSPL
jgi:hypothetical protein